MASYKVLRDPARFLTTERLQALPPAQPIFPEVGSYGVRGMGASIDEEAVAERLGSAITGWTGDRERSDADFALLIRNTLVISRRDAADVDLWTFLNATAGWHYVVWRWSSTKGIVGRGRVSGGLDRSALARLWWMAELVGGDTDHERLSRLRVLLRWQDRAVQLYERPRLIRRKQLVPDLLEVSDTLADEWSEAGFRRFAASVRAGFGVRLPIAMNYRERKQIIENRALMTSMD